MIGGILLDTKREKTLRSNMTPDTQTGLSSPCCKGNNYEIRVKGQLSDVWADWFEGLTIERLDDGETILSGYIVDQSALMGTLNKLARLNLTLISVNEINTKKHEETK